MHSIASKRGLISSESKMVFAFEKEEKSEKMDRIVISRRKLADAIDWSGLLTNPGALCVKQVFILVKQAPSRLHVVSF